MYTKRATFNSLRHLHKVCGRNPTDFPRSVRIPDFVRNFGTATERSDAYSNFDRNAAESQAGYSSYNQNDQFYGGNLGEFQQRQNPNPSMVYEQRIGNESFNPDHSLHNYGNRNLDGGELNQSPNQNHGLQHGSGGKVQHNENINGVYSRGSLGTPPRFHGGLHRLKSREDFAGGSNFSGSYSRNEDMQVQNVRSSRVYEQTIGNDSLNRDHSSYNYGNRNLDGGELNQSPNQIHGQNPVLQHGGGGKVEQNENVNGFDGRGTLGTPPRFHGGLDRQNFREDFAGASNFPGSYSRNEDVQVQNVHSAWVHPQNVDVNYHLNGGITDSQVTTDTKLNAGSVEVVQESQFMGKLEDLDKFTKEGKLKEAVELLGLLQNEGAQVELPRYIALMKACGENEALVEAKSVHEHLLKSGVHLETSTYNQILEMYSRCGSMNDAFAVFDRMSMRNLTSWDIMISWLAKNGLGEDSLELFAEFKESGLKPDGEMFIGVFSACGVLCDTVEGMLHFESMMKDYSIVPTMKHYVSIVEMLGTAGCLDEALDFIEKMPTVPSVEIWETLMNSCRIHGNMELGDRCADLVGLLDPSRLNEQSRAGLIPISAADLAREKEKKKLSGQNPLDIRSRVHEYRAGDRSPDNDRIYELLRGLKQQMKEVGYVPETKFVLHDVDQEVKEEALMAHSERLAAAQGFLTSAARSPLRIIKNLRFCGDCHNAFKIISRIVGREIVARDSKRFHHFRDGVCSCNDFW